MSIRPYAGPPYASSRMFHSRSITVTAKESREKIKKESDRSSRSMVPPPLLVAMVMIILAGMPGELEILALEGVPPPANCTRSCGGKDFPYPFGFSEDCYLSRSYSLTCNYSYSPPKTFFGDFEVLDVILPSGRMRVLLNISYLCYTTSNVSNSFYSLWNVSLYDRFTLSYEENLFMAVGCDTMAKFGIGSNRYSGCMTGCNSLRDVGIEDGQCLGIGCCQTHVPERINFYQTDFYYRDNTSETYKFNNCSYSFMVEKNNYTFRKSHLQYMDLKTKFPMILDWFIGDESCDEALKDITRYACVSSHSECFNSNNGPGYICNCSQGYQGNPYLDDGCQDIDECKLDRKVYPCYGNCVNTEGSYNCTCLDGYTSKDPKIENCTVIPETGRQSSISRPLIAGIVIVGVILLLLLGILLSCLIYQRRKNIRLKRKFFEQNGGIHLQQALSTTNQVSSFKIFKEEDLEKATENFDDEFMIGYGGSGKVYRGTFEDKTVIAVKRFMTADEKDGREFANEILILSKVNHTNIVKLLGCCLESKIPMLVYEYIPRGTLYNYIHNKKNWYPILFNVRLQLAVETARALKYLHIDASPPICHGDVKSSNILLDEGHVVKVSDFGTSILAPKDNTQFKTLVQGTYGYLDPEYLLTGYVTDKSDVFSYGVVLAELLTRKMPILPEENGRGKNLSNEFVSCANENKLEEIIDPDLMIQGLSKEIKKVAGITVRCLSMQGKYRPTMKEVVAELEELVVHERHPWEQYYLPEEDRLLGDASTSGHHYTSMETRAIFAVEGAR